MEIEDNKWCRGKLGSQAYRCCIPQPAQQPVAYRDHSLHDRIEGHYTKNSRIGELETDIQKFERINDHQQERGDQDTVNRMDPLSHHPVDGKKCKHGH